MCSETTDESDENTATTTAEEDQEFKRKLSEANKLIDKVKNTLKDLRMSVNVKKNVEGRKDECVECGETELSCFLEGGTTPKETTTEEVVSPEAPKQTEQQQQRRDSIRASVNLAQFLLTQPEELAAAPKSLAQFIHAQLETLTQAAMNSEHQEPADKQDQATIYSRHCVSDLCLSQDLCCNVSNPGCCRDENPKDEKPTATGGAAANDSEITSEEEMPLSVLNTIVEESEGDVPSRTIAEGKESGKIMERGAHEKQGNGPSSSCIIRDPLSLMDRGTSPVKSTKFDNTVEVHQDSSHSQEEVRNTYSTMVGHRPDKVSEYSDHIASAVHSRRSSVVAPSLNPDDLIGKNMELLREKLEKQRQKQLEDEREWEKHLEEEQQAQQMKATCSQKCSERRRQNQSQLDQQSQQTNGGLSKGSSLAMYHQGCVDSCGSHPRPREQRGSFTVKLSEAVVVQEIDPVAEDSETLIAKTSFDNGKDLDFGKPPKLQIQTMPSVNIAPGLTMQATLNLEIKPTGSSTNAVASDEAIERNVGFFQVKRDSVVEQPSSNPQTTTSPPEKNKKTGSKCARDCKKKIKANTMSPQRMTADISGMLQMQIKRLENQGSGPQPTDALHVQLGIPVDFTELNEEQEDDLVRLILKSYQCVKEGGSSHELDMLEDASLSHLLSEVDLDVYRTYINPDYSAKIKKVAKVSEQEEKFLQMQELVKAYVQRNKLPEKIVESLVIQTTDPHSIGFYATKSCQTSLDNMYVDQFYNNQFGVKTPPMTSAAFEDTPERDVFGRKRSCCSSSTSSDSGSNNRKIQCSLSNSEEETSSTASLVSTTISHFLGGLVEHPGALMAMSKHEHDDEYNGKQSNEPSASVDEETDGNELHEEQEEQEDPEVLDESKRSATQDNEGNSNDSKKPTRNSGSPKEGTKSPSDSMDRYRLAEKWNKLIEKKPPVAVGSGPTTTKEAFDTGSLGDSNVPESTVMRMTVQSPPRLEAGKDDALGRLAEFTSRVECVRPTTCRSLKRQHYRMETSTSDSVSVNGSSARAEASRCARSSLSGGEIRETCKDLHGRTYNIKYLKRHPEKVLQYELDDNTLKLSRQRKYYSHWIAYYVQKHKRLPTEEDKNSSANSSKRSPRGK